MRNPCQVRSMAREKVRHGFCPLPGFADAEANRADRHRVLRLPVALSSIRRVGRRGARSFGRSSSLSMRITSGFFFAA